MEISLIRHGKSTLTNNDKMTCTEFKQWVEEYDRAGVFAEDSYPLETLEAIAKAKIVVTSDLKRSMDSALLLQPSTKFISNPLFRETELPTSFSKIGILKLKPSIWTVIARCLWLIGYSHRCESLRDAKIRAAKAAQVLVDYGREYHDVALVGHGFFNMLVAQELRKIGMKGNRRTSSGHWNVTTYTLL